MKYFFRVAILALTLGQLSACNSTKSLVIPKVGARTENSSIGLNESRVTFALAKLINDIDRGEPIFAFPLFPTTSGTFCNQSYKGDTTVTYIGGKQYLGDWYSDLGKVFYETLVEKGYNMAGDPSDLFSVDRAVRSAEYLIGGRLLNMKGNFCHSHHWWDGTPLNEFSGEMFVEFEWSVFNTLTKELVLKKKIKGYYRQESPIKQGIILTFSNAFADSAEQFASSNELLDLARGKKISADAPDKEGVLKLAIINGKRRNTDGLENAIENVVTVRVGGGHGSGFFIGNKGYLLTNAHVVGTARKVRIVMSSGFEITAEVIASMKVRDVALLKAPVTIPRALRIDTKLPKIADEVYATGSPLLEELRFTVTKGIVSALRKDKKTGLKHIQGDVAISPGNSGGPLMNDQGHVIGISVAGYSGDGAENLNLFIPIGDALTALGITLK